MKNEKRKLLEGWAKSKLSELAVYINGKAFKPEEWEKEGTPIIRIENLTDEKAPFNYYRDECEEKYKIVDGDLLVSWSATNDFFREPNAQTSFVPMESVDELTGSITKKIKRTYSEISKGYTFFEEGDVLFAKITPCMQNAKSAIAKGMIDRIGFGSTEFHLLRPKIGVIKEWIYYFVRTSEFRKRAEDHFEGGAGQQRVPVDFIENVLIPLPSTLDDQIRIANELERKMAEIEKMRQAADNQLEAIGALPGAILRVAFDFEAEEAS